MRAGSDRFTISKDTLIDNIKYWLVQYQVNNYNSYSYFLERIDTTTGKVFRQSDRMQMKCFCVDNVYANAGDTVLFSGTCIFLPVTSWLSCRFMIQQSIISKLPFLPGYRFALTTKTVLCFKHRNARYRGKILAGLRTGEWRCYKRYFSDITNIDKDEEVIFTDFLLSQNTLIPSIQLQEYHTLYLNLVKYL